MVYRLVAVDAMHSWTIERVNPNIAPDCCYYYPQIQRMVCWTQYLYCIVELNRRSIVMVD